MSWDVWIVRPREGLEAVSDLRSGDLRSSFNQRGVHAAAQAVFERVEAMGWVGSNDTRTFAPVDLVDASFLRIDGPDVYGELGLPGREDDSLTLNVRSGSERLTAVILEFAARLDARALDLQTGDWLTVDQGEASYSAWNAYKRRVISGSPSDSADGS